MKLHFEKAKTEDLQAIWSIIRDAIQRRRADGSEQWQNGYPNEQILAEDIASGAGYVVRANERIAGYCAVMINDEPAYAAIEGRWLTSGDFVVFHRVAIAGEFLGMGLAKALFGYIEDFAREHGVGSVRADTNFDNAAMLALFDRMGYVYCGEVFFRGKSRRAYEKLVNK